MTDLIKEWDTPIFDGAIPTVPGYFVSAEYPNFSSKITYKLRAYNHGENFDDVLYRLKGIEAEYYTLSKKIYDKAIAMNPDAFDVKINLSFEIFHRR